MAPCSNCSLLLGLSSRFSCLHTDHAPKGCMIISSDCQRRLTGARAAEQEAEGFVLPLGQRYRRVADLQWGAASEAIRDESRREVLRTRGEAERWQHGQGRHQPGRPAVWVRGWDRRGSLREGVQGPRPEEWWPLRGAEAGAGADQWGRHAAVHHSGGGRPEAPGDLRAPQRGQVRKRGLLCGVCTGRAVWAWGGPGHWWALWIERELLCAHGVWFEVSTGCGAVPELTSSPCCLPHTQTPISRGIGVWHSAGVDGKEPHTHHFLRHEREWKPSNSLCPRY